MVAAYRRWITETVGDVHWRLIVVNGKKLYTHRGSKLSPDGDPMVERCDLVVPLMAAQFPELRQAVGNYVPAGRNSGVYHHWLVAPDGSIIDPTGAQFDLDGPGSYVLGTYIETQLDHEVTGI